MTPHKQPLSPLLYIHKSVFNVILSVGIS